MTDGNGRDAEFEAIFRRYYARIFRFCRSCGFSDTESDDLAQETFRKFWEAMQRHYRGDAVWGYLQSIARHVVYNATRDAKAQKRNAVTIDLDDPASAIDIKAPPESDYADREEAASRSRRLHEAIEELTEAQQQCLKLWLDELQLDQIARVLGVSTDAVKSRLRDARRVLSKWLGGDPPEEK